MPIPTCAPSPGAMCISTSMASEATVRLLATPSTGAQFLPRSEHFAIDQRPPAYRRLTLHANGTVDTDVVWLTKALADGGLSAPPARRVRPALGASASIKRRCSPPKPPLLMMTA